MTIRFSILGIQFGKTKHSPTGARIGMSRIGDNESCVVWLETAEAPEWDEFVRRHPQGLVYHLSAWKTVLEQSFTILG